MTVVFVVDTSASMNQRCANGLTLLDCAKSAVEHFLKMRARDFSWHRTDRYILVTSEDGKSAIKVVDRFPFTNFMRTLKSIEAHDLTQTGAALQQVFDYLHLQRLANDIDKYGQGRNPCSMEPTTILLLTDGTELTYQTGVLKTIVPSGPLPLGGELTAKPFRWDQRVSAIVLRIPSVSQQVLERSGPFPQNAPISGLQTAVAMDSDISAFCESTGGKCFVATSWKILMQHIDATSRLTTCVVVNFENVPIPGSVCPPPQVHAACQRKLLFIKPNQPHQGHWPIPEAYWPDPSQFVLPSRDPHPTIAYKAVDSDPMIPTQFVYDKYEVESNPIAGFLLKAPAGACWQVFVRNSKGPQNGYGDPFGHLRLDRLGNTLTLFVLPYNYPVLFQLLDQAGKFPKMSKEIWRQEMERYFNSVPCYYGPPLRAALRQWGLNTHIVPDSLEKSLLSGFIGNQLKRLKAQAKTEWENMTEKIMASTSALKSNQRNFPVLAAAPENPLPTHTFTTTSFSVRLSSSTSNEPALTQKTFEVSVPASPSAPSTLNSQSLKPINTTEAAKAASEPNTGTWKDCAVFKNPFDVSREELLSQLTYLPVRVALSIDGRAAAKNIGNGSKLSTIGALAARFVAKAEEEARHSVPIEKMGDFSDALSKQQPPRNPFADEQERSKQQRFMFGNPYRQEKNEGADEAWSEGSGGAPFRGRKRRRRPESPSASATSTSSSENISAAGNMEATSPARNDSKSDGVDDMAQASSDSGTSVSETEQDTSNPLSAKNSEVVPSVTEPVAPKRKKRPPRPEEDRASDFILAALRALRHATSSNDTELFELLVACEVPLDKSHLVEQLIHQAHCYKKAVIASRLVDFRSKLTTEGA